MTDTQTQDQARAAQDALTNFGVWADETARWRPECPDEAVTWLVGDAKVVADIGAGSGRLSRRIADLGVTVHAVEPDPRMLHVLRKNVPGATGHLGGSDDIPLDDASVDVVVNADSWSWMTRAVSLAEVRRVLRAGGRLGLVRDVVAPKEAWEEELASLKAGDASVDWLDQVRGRLPEGTVEVERFGWSWDIHPQMYATYLGSTSELMGVPPQDRQARLERASQIVGRARDEAGTATVPLHHEAVCLRWTPA